MRFRSAFLLSILTWQALAASDGQRTWAELRARREALPVSHQEFEISRTFKLTGTSQESKSSVVVDLAGERWRERTISGAGGRIGIFDGEDLFELEDGDSEYVRVKRSSKDELPQPGPYSAPHLYFSKVIEQGRRPCGLSNVEHECVTLDIPVKPWVRNTTHGELKMMGGTTRVLFDTATGLLIYSRTVQNIDNQHGGYQSDVTYMLKRMSYNGAVDESLFKLPSSATTEVKELARWDADKIKKQLAGKAAPDFALTDLQGRAIELSDLKGKTVLLDFWATWCGPCREDGPSLDKLYQKYGARNLAIIGISVDEERPVVQKFLSEHPHKYPIALTTENEMPRAYQIGVFPTYIAINAEGNLASATEGDKGFSELRKRLKKAGLETE